MGNCACTNTQKELQILSPIYGKILYSPPQNNSNTQPYYLITESSYSQSEINKKRDYWTTIYNLPTIYLIKPFQISAIKISQKFFFIKKYSFYLKIEELAYSLKEFSFENLKVVPFIPEILLVNLLSGLVVCLFWLFRQKILHCNLSMNSVFLSARGDWVLMPPNFRKVNLFSRMEREEGLVFLIPRDFKGFEVGDKEENKGFKTKIGDDIEKNLNLKKNGNGDIINSNFVNDFKTNNHDEILRNVDFCDKSEDFSKKISNSEDTYEDAETEENKIRDNHFKKKTYFTFEKKNSEADNEISQDEEENEKEIYLRKIFSIDVYSLGICILNTVYPFEKRFLNNFLDEKIIENKINFFESYYSKDLVDILKRMLIIDSKKRISIEDLFFSLKDF